MNSVHDSYQRFHDHCRRLAGESAPDGLCARIDGINGDIRAKGIYRDERSGKEILTGYDYAEFYDWDLYFENIYQSYFGVSKYCFSNLDAFFLRQREDGFIPRSFGTHNYGKDHPFKPFIAQTALLGTLQSRDIDWIGENFERISKYLSSWYSRYDPDNNHLCYWVNADASGMDNQTSRVLGTLQDEGVDLNCYLYREHRAMAELARLLGRDAEAERYTVKAERIKEAVNDQLWDEGDGIYYDRIDKTGLLHREKGVSAFMPLWAGIASREQARRLVKEHLINPSEFWAQYPVCTLSRDSTAYRQFGAQPPSGLCNWNGTTWIPTNYMVFHGLMDYGYRDIARALAEKTFELVYVRNERTREYYNADDGSGYGRNPFYGWSTLGYFMLLEYELNYDPTGICAAHRILPLLCGADEAKRRRLGN